MSNGGKGQYERHLCTQDIIAPRDRVRKRILSLKNIAWVVADTVVGGAGEIPVKVHSFRIVAVFASEAGIALAGLICIFLTGACK
jgi:hypothetical protein